MLAVIEPMVRSILLRELREFLKDRGRIPLVCRLPETRARCLLCDVGLGRRSVLCKRLY